MMKDGKRKIVGQLGRKHKKRALRVLDTEEEAIKYMEWHKNTDSAYMPKYTGGYEIDFRQGEYNRCKGNYCSVADFCQQYNKGVKKMAKKKTKETVSKLKRARTSKGRFVADNPDTPENEAFVKADVKVKAEIKKASKPKVPVSHIRERLQIKHKSQKKIFS